jgi:hypothetical protein
MANLSIRYDIGGPDGALARLLPFQTHGAMRAVTYAPDSTGRLPAQWAHRYRDDQHTPGIVYAVVSYATPIAWVRVDGRTVVPPVTYSPTTTRHQNLCLAWLGASTPNQAAAAA